METYSDTSAQELRGFRLFHETQLRGEQGFPYNSDISNGMTRDEVGKLIMAFNSRFSYQLFPQQDMDVSTRCRVKFYAVKKSSCMSSGSDDYHLKMAKEDEIAMNSFVLAFMTACQLLRKKSRRL